MVHYGLSMHSEEWCSWYRGEFALHCKTSSKCKDDLATVSTSEKILCFVCFWLEHTVFIQSLTGLTCHASCMYLCMKKENSCTTSSDHGLSPWILVKAIVFVASIKRPITENEQKLPCFKAVHNIPNNRNNEMMIIRNYNSNLALSHLVDGEMGNSLQVRDFKVAESTVNY